MRRNLSDNSDKRSPRVAPLHTVDRQTGRMAETHHIDRLEQWSMERRPMLSLAPQTGDENRKV
jgi:hypothetical protein